MIRMSVSAIRRMGKGSAYTGRLAQGCVQCEKGAKMVLLVTGRCARRCSYCPLSKAKKGRDVFYANERRVEHMSEIVDEAELIDALGTGVTGGDPLIDMDRTVRAIGLLKDAFGQSHHVHLYTSTTDVRRVRKVASAGLDEIRFHPPAGMWRRLGGSDFTDAVRAARRAGLSTGLEIPVIPGKEDGLAGAIAFAESEQLDFVNLNELEFSETNWEKLHAQGMVARDDLSSGVAGSEELAMELLGGSLSVPLHYCSSAFKDGVQLRRRIMRRGRNVRRPHEILTDDGTLLKGVVETDRPEEVMRMLIDEHDVPVRLMAVDDGKRRLEVAPWVLEEMSSELELDSYLVEEYPTADRLEVERTPLKRR